MRHIIILRYFKFCIIYPQEERGFLFSHPEGLRKVLNYIKDKYNNMPVYIKENGKKPFLLTRNSENFFLYLLTTKFLLFST